MSAVLAIDVAPHDRVVPGRAIEQDYRWAIRMGFFTHSDMGWREWVKGWDAGREIGQRMRRSRRPQELRS